MRAILTLVAVWLAAAATPDITHRYLVVPTGAPSDTGVRPCPAVAVGRWRSRRLRCARRHSTPRTRTAGRTCTCSSARPTG